MTSKAINTALMILVCTQAEAQVVRRAEPVVGPVVIHAQQGRMTAQAGALPVTFRYRSGRQEDGHVIGVFEPITRAFWWWPQPGDNARYDRLNWLRDYSWLQLAGQTMVGFWSVGDGLGVRESSARASSLEDGFTNALAVLNASPEVIEGGEQPGTTYHDLSGLGREFFNRAGSALGSPPPHIVHATRDGAGWTITLEGPDEDRVAVTLDPGYKLLGIDPLPLAEPIEFDIASELGPVAVRLAARSVALRVSSGAGPRAHVYGVFDRVSRQFWWTPVLGEDPTIGLDAVERFRRKTVLFKSGSTIVGFRIGGTRLGVRQLSETASSLEEGMSRAATSLASNAPTSAPSETLAWYATVDLSSLGEFLTWPITIISAPDATIESVTRDAAGWHLTLVGPRQRTGVIVLDHSFKLIAAKLPQPQ